MLGALSTARERHFAGSAHGMTAMVEAEGMIRRAPAALTGPGDASASRDLRWYSGGPMNDSGADLPAHP
jgi:hypothetical protein